MSDPGGLMGTYRGRGLLVDANLLLVLVLGDVDRDCIGKISRTSEYSPPDYDVLLKLIGFFDTLATTPNILTEVSNLLATALGREDRRRRPVFERMAEFICVLTEEYIESADASGLPRFDVFGLTDLGILQAAKGRFLVLTDDNPLADYLGREGVDVLRFRDVRALDGRG